MCSRYSFAVPRNCGAGVNAHTKRTRGGKEEGVVSRHAERGSVLTDMDVFGWDSWDLMLEVHR